MVSDADLPGAPEGAVDSERGPVSGWPFFRLAWPLRGYVMGWVLIWGLVVGLATRFSTWQPVDALTAAFILVCAVVATELGPGRDSVAGPAKDLLSAWFLPIAFILPPVYALVTPVVLMGYKQLRGTRNALYRRGFSIATTGLCLAGASWLFDRMMAGARWWGGIDPQLAWVLAATVCAALYTCAVALLVAVAVRLYSPERSLRTLVGDRQALVIDVAEVATGLLVAAVCQLSPWYIALAVIPAVLVQRGLMHDQLTAAARLDTKTGLLNARTWETETDSEIARAVRTRSTLAVMLIDLDHFKQINDRYGHLIGDEVLKAVAEVMRSQVREYDKCARFGGDEFAILLPQTDLAEATRTAERIQRRVSVITVVTDSDELVSTSVSIGVAQWASGHGLSDLLAAADVCLYRAKADGRDRVVPGAAEQVKPFPPGLTPG